MNRATSLYELFESTVAQKPDAPALGIIQAGSLRWLTWKELQGLVDSAASQLTGDRPVVDLNNTRALTFILCDLAVQKVGGVTVCGRHDGRIPLTHRVVESEARPLFQQLDRPRESPPVPEDVGTIQFTSGTSGQPRGVMLSSENLVSNTVAVADSIAASLEHDTQDETRLSFLPFTHLYARVGDFYAWLYRGSRLVLAENRETIWRDCLIAKPQSLNGVPYFYEKTLALLRQDQDSSSVVTLAEKLGGVRRCYCGGAPLSPDLQNAYEEAGLPLMSGYGLSEASPVVTVSTILSNRLGAVGKPLPSVEVQLAGDGEILVRGPNVMLGYWNDPAATAEVLINGWLHTGDLGQWDGKDFLSITGRKKELIALATGKKVAPSSVESRLTASPWIEQAAVIGEGLNGLAAIIVPNPQLLRAEVKRQRLWVWSKKRALTHPKIREIYRQQIEEALRHAPKEEQVHNFVLIGRAFSAEQGEITPKLSLRREAIEKNFAREIGKLVS